MTYLQFSDAQNSVYLICWRSMASRPEGAVLPVPVSLYSGHPAVPCAALGNRVTLMPGCRNLAKNKGALRAL